MLNLAVAYLRVSTAANQYGHGFDRQKQAIDAFADWGRFQLQKIFHEVWGMHVAPLSNRLHFLPHRQCTKWNR